MSSMAEWESKKEKKLFLAFHRRNEQEVEEERERKSFFSNLFSSSIHSDTNSLKLFINSCTLIFEFFVLIGSLVKLTR